MSMISYVDIRSEAVAYLKKVFSKAKGLIVDAHPGVFDVEELKRIALRAPAILTGLMDIDANDNHKLKFSTWIVVRGSTKDTLFDAALRYLTVVIPALKEIDAEWSDGGAKEVSARNLFTTSTAALNVGIWVVVWSWNVRGDCIQVVDDETIGGILLPDELGTFEGYDAEHKVGSTSVSENVTLQ